MAAKFEEDKTMTLKDRFDNKLWDKLAEHWSHNVSIVKFGDPGAPDNVCLECEDCGTVVLDAEIYTLRARDEGQETSVRSVLDAILEALPKEPMPFNTDDNFWTNGDEILCPSETACETLAEFFKALLKGTTTDVLTGWYDPAEDTRNSESDECTGFDYIRFE